MLALHVLDPSTSPDAIEMLALLVTRWSGAEHRVLVLGHADIARQAIAAGIPAERIAVAHSMGWADPAGWRALRRAIAGLSPTHLHAWGLSGVVAGTVESRFAGPRVATFAAPLSSGQLRLLGIACRRAAWSIAVSSSSLQRSFLQAGLDPQKVRRIRPGIPLAAAAGEARTPLRKSLGLTLADGPVILLGGEAVRAARHDRGLWAAGILWQMYPATRVLLRVPQPTAHDSRGLHTRAFADTISAPDMVRFVPPDMPWPKLMQAADILLVTPDAPIATGSILWAMAAGVPVIGTAIECVSELIAHGQTGLLAQARPGGIATDDRSRMPPGGGPKQVAARLEQFMSDSTLRWPLTDKARAEVYAEFQPQAMVEAFGELYKGGDGGRGSGRPDEVGVGIAKDVRP